MILTTVQSLHRNYLAPKIFVIENEFIFVSRSLIALRDSGPASSLKELNRILHKTLGSFHRTASNGKWLNKLVIPSQWWLLLCMILLVRRRFDILSISVSSFARCCCRLCTKQRCLQTRIGVTNTGWRTASLTSIEKLKNYCKCYSQSASVSVQP